jgi:hypothetical protein
MSKQVKRTSLRARTKDFVAKGLLADGTRIWMEDRHRIDEAIGLVEQAWSLTRDPRIAVQLGTMYDQANRNDDALVVLREAWHRHPQDRLVRHHAAITLLRHGEAADTRDFFDSVLKVDPDDAFARFVTSVLDSYDIWVGELAASIERTRDGRQPFVISCPVWGQPFAEYFARYICGSLLSPNNLPEVAKRHSVHLAVFTNEPTEDYLRADPLFARLQAHATVHFMRYTAEQVGYPKRMEACYGHQKIFYSKRPLAFYYARNCKFVLMSCAHYAALAAGRATDALVSCQVADTMLNDGGLKRIADLLAGEVDAVLINCLPIEGKDIRPMLDQTFRRPDGALELSSASCTKLVVDHLPAYNFIEPSGLLNVPLRACWRVGNDGVLIHGNHYHPIGLRPAKFAHPLQLSIDPIDSRFIDRTSLEMDRIHLVQDASIVGMSVEEGPLPEQLELKEGALSAADAAFWLWGYWGRLRGTFFRMPLRFGSMTARDEWRRVERAASAVVDGIVRQAAELEAKHRKQKSWHL